MLIARRSSEVCTTSGSRPASRSSSPPRTASAAALVGEVDVDPAGEEVLGVPLALAVAEQDQRVGHGGRRHCWGSAGRRRLARRRAPTVGSLGRRWPVEPCVVAAVLVGVGDDGDVHGRSSRRCRRPSVSSTKSPASKSPVTWMPPSSARLTQPPGGDLDRARSSATCSVVAAGAGQRLEGDRLGRWSLLASEAMKVPEPSWAETITASSTSTCRRGRWCPSAGCRPGRWRS